jgi:hypothetical protein
MHEYDDNWQCKCGYRLIADFDSKTGRMKLIAYVTPEGKTVPFGENLKENEKPKQPTKHASKHCR